jgi:hypothetical protein
MKNECPSTNPRVAKREWGAALPERPPYRVIGVDTFDNESWHEGEFGSLSEAVAFVRRRVGREEMFKMYIYDCQGNYIKSFGTF